jgi:hypothetical protein
MWAEFFFVSALRHLNAAEPSTSKSGLRIVTERTALRLGGQRKRTKKREREWLNKKRNTYRQKKD